MTNTFKGKTVLVTGGSGSFGRAFLERAKEFKPRLIKIYSRNEYLLWQVKRKFGQEIELIIGDVRDCERLDYAMRGVDIVIHAAALKQIDFCEENPDEAFKTNVLGSRNVVASAVKNKVGRAVNLSSDKAVYPTSVYGATKFLAEKAFQEGNNFKQTIFFSLRYSNVISSRGSVLENFINIAQKGKELEVYSKAMERFFVTQDEVIELLGYALPLAKGGETLLIAPPKVKIYDLACAIAKSNPRAKVTVKNQVREGEKESAVLVDRDELPRLYRLKKNWLVVLPRNVKVKEGRVVSAKEWEKMTNAYATPQELKDLINKGKKELCV